MSAMIRRNSECYDRVPIQCIVQTRILNRVKRYTINAYVRTTGANQNYSGKIATSCYLSYGNKEGGGKNQ